MRIYGLTDAHPIFDVDDSGHYAKAAGFRDAEVVVFACGCAACFPMTGFNDPGTLYPDYPTAAGRARMIVAMASAR